jgi:hypothetical protein
MLAFTIAENVSVVVTLGKVRKSVLSKDRNDRTLGSRGAKDIGWIKFLLNGASFTARWRRWLLGAQERKYQPGY